VKKRLLYIIITLIIISLLGVIGLQYFWIRTAYSIKEAQFGRSVRDAMERVTEQLETREKAVFLSKEFIKDSITAMVNTMGIDKDLSAQLEDERAAEQMDSEALELIPPPPPPPERFEFTVDFNGNTHVVVVPQPQQARPPRRRISHAPDQLFEFPQEADYNWIVMDGDSSRTRVMKRVESNIRKINKTAGKMKDFVQKMTIEVEELSKPIEKRIDIETLKNLLKSSFADKGIRLPFEFAIVSPFDTAKVIPVKSQFFITDQINSPFRVTLFPNDIFQKPHYLVVFFHGQKTHIIKSFAYVLMVSVFFTLIIILSSVLSIVFMIRQKKLSDIKTDFINNMTHEFKTPIATISVAADSITNPKVVSEPARIRDFTRVIKEENTRMNARVEQVLQMALIDSKDFRLRPEEVDAHELIRLATENFRLIIAKREGILNLALDARNSVIVADPDHLRNVIVNLLDNANKYSPERPEITVTTYNRSGKLFIAIEDKGMGMNPETRRKVFDKFFRYSTGNIHGIKGFGLGLSYVKAIVLAHKGEVQVTSEPGKGSRFEISLPVVEEFDDEESES
jgi:signal transduction histidine kinase